MIQRMATVAILLVQIVHLLAHSSAHAAPPAPSLKQRLNRLVMDFYPSANEPGAAVLVMVDGKRMLRKGYGMADLEKGVKLKPDTIFRIASITKQFTSICVLQLVQQGKISLDDPISKHLPDFDTRGETITIENLLTHTSGLPNYTALPGYLDGLTRILKPKDIVSLVDGMPLAFAPGTRFRYSNTNYVLLGMLIEKVSGRTYEQYLESSITRRLGLADTRYSHDHAQTPRHARGYELDQSGKWTPMRPISMSQPYAAGAIESTVDDLAKWTLALANGKGVEPKLLKRAWTPYKLAEGQSEYGYGWFIRVEAGERWIGHNGGINGFQSSAVWIPEKKVFVAILHNGLGNYKPDVLLRRLALEAVGRPEPKRVAIALPVEILDRYVGVYVLSPEVKFTISRRGDRLIAQAPNKSTLELMPEAEDKFFNAEADLQVSFTLEAGNTTQMTLRRAGRDSIAKRES